MVKLFKQHRGVALIFLMGIIFLCWGAYGSRLSNGEASKIITASRAFKEKFPEQKSFMRSGSTAIPQENLGKLITAGAVIRNGNYYFSSQRGESADFTLRYIDDTPHSGLPPHWMLIATTGKTPSLHVVSLTIDRKSKSGSAIFYVIYTPNEPIYSWCCLVSDGCKTTLSKKYEAVLKKYDKGWAVEHIGEVS